MDTVIDIDLDFFCYPIIFYDNDLDFAPMRAANRRNVTMDQSLWLDPLEFFSKLPQVSRYRFREHNEVLYLWYFLIREGRLRVPFRVYHFDGHHDLYDDDGQVRRALEADSDLSVERVLQTAGPADYLLWAHGIGWIEHITWIRPAPAVNHYGGIGQFFLDQLNEKDVARVSARSMKSEFWVPQLKSEFTDCLPGIYDTPIETERFGRRLRLTVTTELRIPDKAVVATLVQSPQYTAEIADESFQLFM